MGPTAIGKSTLALQLAEQYPVKIINVDSALIYRGMDIGTAKPSLETIKQYPHYLIDIRDPYESYSAAQFALDASQLIHESWRANQIPLLVGGTMLYFKALYQGMANLPAADAKVRAMIEEKAKKIGWDKMHEKLQAIDPIAAKKIHPNDPQRLQRALEVYHLTGESISTAWEKNKTVLNDYQSLNIALIPLSRDALAQRITIRFHDMLHSGFIDEVEKLYQRRDLHVNLPSMRAVGYRQVWQYLSGEYNYDTMVNKAIIATRQLAKRQLTWLKRWPNLSTFDPFDDHARSKIERVVDRFLNIN